MKLIQHNISQGDLFILWQTLGPFMFTCCNLECFFYELGTTLIISGKIKLHRIEVLVKNLWSIICRYTMKTKLQATSEWSSLAPHRAIASKIVVYWL